ncbi:MAG: PIG-L deacetylase family protein [Polyangiales bacterium]
MSGVLSVFAHPDDEVLCAAGTLALCASRGERVSLVCATRGEYGPIASDALATPETLASVRDEELHASCAALGVQDVELLGLPDAGVDWAAAEQNSLRVLVERIRRSQPRLLITFGPDGLYGHPDHVAVGELASRARLLAADPHFVCAGLAPHRIPRLFFPVWTHTFVRELLAVAPQVQLWSLQPAQFPLEDNVISASVDVHAVLDRKLRAIASHRTQLTADHVLTHADNTRLRTLLSVEHFRCADGLPGDPLAP